MANGTAIHSNSKPTEGDINQRARERRGLSELTGAA